MSTKTVFETRLDQARAIAASHPGWQLTGEGEVNGDTLWVGLIHPDYGAIGLSLSLSANSAGQYFVGIEFSNRICLQPIRRHQDLFHRFLSLGWQPHWIAMGDEGALSSLSTHRKGNLITQMGQSLLAEWERIAILLNQIILLDNQTQGIISQV